VLAAARRLRLIAVRARASARTDRLEAILRAMNTCRAPTACPAAHAAGLARAADAHSAAMRAQTTLARRFSRACAATSAPRDVGENLAWMRGCNAGADRADVAELRAAPPVMLSRSFRRVGVAQRSRSKSASSRRLRHAAR
jgi:hypothetical protein